MKFTKYSALFSFIALNAFAVSAHAFTINDQATTFIEVPALKSANDNLHTVNSYKATEKGGVDVQLDHKDYYVNLACDDPAVRANRALVADILKVAFLTGTRVLVGVDNTMVSWAQFQPR